VYLPAAIPQKAGWLLAKPAPVRGRSATGSNLQGRDVQFHFSLVAEKAIRREPFAFVEGMRCLLKFREDWVAAVFLGIEYSPYSIWTTGSPLQSGCC
jgi:hypothetical protein